MPKKEEQLCQICNECGRSVAFGSGRFVNRVPDLNSAEERKEMGKPHPEGDFMCAECDGEYNCEDCGRLIEDSEQDPEIRLEDGDTLLCKECAGKRGLDVESLIKKGKS